MSANIDGRISGGALFVAKVLQAKGNGQIRIDVRNQLRKNDKIEIISPRGPVRKGTILTIIHQDHQEVDVVNPGNQVEITIDGEASPNDIIRKVTL